MFATRRVTAEIFSTIDVPPREWQYVQHRSRRRASKGWGRYQPMQGIVQLVSRHSGAHTCLLQTQPRRITPDFLSSLSDLSDLNRNLIESYKDNTATVCFW